MARARWQRERERRLRQAAHPEQYPGQIVRRIVVIDREQEVREAVIFSGDSLAVARRKEREVLSPRAGVAP